MGIGFETTKYIINNTASLVVVYGLHAVEECLALEKANPGRLSICTGDVTKPSSGKDAVKFALEKMGGLDTLVYCIGIMAPIERIADVDLDKVRQTFEVNVFGCISMCQGAIPYLRESEKGGDILILSSGCDWTVQYSGWMAYCSSKAALSRFIKLLALEETTLKVRGVYPKLTGTGMPQAGLAGQWSQVMTKKDLDIFTNLEVEPPSWCGIATGRMAAGLDDGGRSGDILDYNEHVVMDYRAVKL